MEEYDYAANVSLKQLKEIVAFAKKYGTSKHKTVRLYFTPGGGIGVGLHVGVPGEEFVVADDITDYGSW